MQLGLLKTILFIMAAIALLSSTFKILKEYERAVIFRLGKLLSTKGPGLIFLIPLVDRMKKIDLRLVSIDVPRQDIMTRDNVPVTVDAVVYFLITDPARAVIGIQNIYQSTFLIAQTTLRNILGQVELDDLLSQQSKINQQLQTVISEHTGQWGIKIPIVEIKEVTLPEEMKRAMAKQAETERERRARIIDAQGEYQAAQTLADAGKILSHTPQSLQLRYLQTLRDISTQKGSTILFPFPLDLVDPFVKGMKKFLQKEEPEKGKEKDDEWVIKEKIADAGSVAGSQVIADEPQSASPQKIEIQSKNEPLSQNSPQQELLTRYQQSWREGKLKPQYVQWLSTERCQFQCAHCETTAQQSNARELTSDEAKKIFDDLADLGCEFLSITGGEPLLRRDIFSLSQYAHQRNLRVGLTTNGQAVEENLIALEKARFDTLVITLDGYKDTQNRLRGSKDAYERGIRTIEFFHDLGAPSIGVSTILLEENIQELPQMTEDVFRAGAHSLQLQPLLFHHGRPTRNSSEVVKNAFRFVLEARRRGFAVEIGEVFGYLGPLEPLVRNTPFFCGCGWNTFCINQEGDVVGCALSKASSLKEGNCRTSSIKDIWEQKFTAFRQTVPSGLPEACAQCEHVSVCRGGCWLFRAQGLNPCFLSEADDVYQEIANALYSQTAEGKSQVLP